MQYLLVFCVSRCVYDSFDDYLSYSKQNHIDTSQLNGILKVYNFYDVENITVAFLFVYEFYQAFVCVTAAGIISVVNACQQVCHFSLHGEHFIFGPCRDIICLSG